MILCIRCILQSGDESAEFWTWSQRRSWTIRSHSQLAHTGSPTTLVKHTKWLLLIHKSPLLLFSKSSNFIAYAFFLSRFRHNVMFHFQCLSFLAMLSYLISCIKAMLFNLFSVMLSCLNAFYRWSTDLTMFTAYMLTWKPGTLITLFCPSRKEP